MVMLRWYLDLLARSLSNSGSVDRDDCLRVRDDLQTLPLAPCLLLGIAILDEMASPILLLGLPVENVTQTQDVPQTPDKRIYEEESANQASIWCQCGQAEHVERNKYYRDVDGAMEVRVLWTDDIVHWGRLCDWVDGSFSFNDIRQAR